MAAQSEPGSFLRGASPRDDLTLLVRAAVDGDQLAWSGLVERFSGLLWSICRAYRLSTADAPDVFQMTWLRLLENLASIQEPERLPAWLATTCRRECLSYLRRNKRSQPTGDDRLLDLSAAGQAVPAADLPTMVAARDAGLWRAFGQLTERCQQILRVLVVTAEDGPPQYELVAASLGIPTGSLGPTRKRCLAQLRKLLDIEGISGTAADS
jgi:RNA polymerase sigma factor (sigma-70 family)